MLAPHFSAETIRIGTKRSSGRDSFHTSSRSSLGRAGNNVNSVAPRVSKVLPALENRFKKGMMKSKQATGLVPLGD